MTADLLVAIIQQGAPMIAVFLAIAVVGGIVYLIRGRSGFERDRASDSGTDTARSSEQ
jgi:hypothetical protein